MLVCKSLDWLRSFIDDGASPRNVVERRPGGGVPPAAQTRLTWDGIWMMNEWDKVKGLEWAAAPLPTIGQNPAVWASSHNFIVTTQATKDRNKLAAARAFIYYISERSIDWAKSGQVPARNSVRESPEFKQLKVQSTLAEQLPNVQFPPSVPGIGDIATPTFETAVNEVILGKKQVKPALDEAAKKANAMLAANRQKYQA